ncbi:glutaredoxin family protein [Faucicola boevrei]|uniref:glutaredoxin family protein n=1 Tax=Faucicola boevrei TaxID=346665 RepID=UPI000375C21E|nr:glutaredoxin family protein [Moraxella boevrei]
MNSPMIWRLYGTVGCHLCELATAELIHAQAVAEFEWEYVDIAEFDNPLAHAWADKIPVLVTPNRTLFYPFSVMDILDCL